MKSIAIIALSTLALASTTAQLTTYSAPTGTTQWTAGQPATISWTNSCNQVVGNTTFPIYLNHQVDQLQVRVPGVPELGYLDCKNAVEITIQVPATHPQGNAYSILVTNNGSQSYSDLFNILSAIPESPAIKVPIGTTVTIGIPTVISTTATSYFGTTITVGVPTVISTIATSPIATTITIGVPTTTKPPESGKTNSNGAVIGGAIAGVAVVSTIIAFVLIRRRQKSRGSGDSEAFAGFNPVLPSVSNAHKDIAEQDEPPSINQREMKVATIHGPQIKPASPQSEPTPLQQDSVSSPTSTYSSTPWVPPGPTLPSNPQVIADKNPLAAYLNRSPQNYPAGTSSVVRSPQLVSPEIVSAVPISYQDLQEQINWMQAELNRRKPLSE